MSNRTEAMEDAVEKAISESEEQHCVDKESFESRMWAEWSEIVEDWKSRTGATV